MYYGLETPLTILFTVIGTIIVLYAQNKINQSYRKYSGILNKNKLTGQEVARQILDANGLGNVHVVSINGELTDHYDPKRKVVRLSNKIFNGESIASVSVAAHECGHAIQDKVGYSFMKLRSALVPFVNFITYSGYFVTFVAIFAGITAYLKVGLVIILATLIFQLVTLPVEFDASARALKELKRLNLIDNYEEEMSKDMLESAAFTYVAGVLNSLINLLRIIIQLKDER